MAAVVKVWRQIKNLSPIVDAYYVKNNPAEFRSDLTWNDGPWIFEEGYPTRMTTRRVVIWNQLCGSFPISLPFMGSQGSGVMTNLCMSLTAIGRVWWWSRGLPVFQQFTNWRHVTLSTQRGHQSTGRSAWTSVFQRNNWTAKGRDANAQQHLL